VDSCWNLYLTDQGRSQSQSFRFELEQESKVRSLQDPIQIFTADFKISVMMFLYLIETCFLTSIVIEA